MKKKENRLFGFLMTVAVVGLFVTVAVVGLFGLPTGQAQGGNTFSGQATGINAAGQGLVDITVAQTDPLPRGRNGRWVYKASTVHTPFLLL
ncbi:MAG: hypothetical protein LC776_15835 [Acidobacteria bacterium]|nr:hypothetical protein [Acidobacteriota bacterium]